MSKEIEFSGFRGGDGSPLVLLHGATSSWRAWKPVIPTLFERHELIIPTLPGHRGGPPMPDSDKGVVGAIVDGVCVQLDQAGVDTAHIVGNSLGGWVALELARRGRARSVVGLSPVGAWRLPRDLDRLLRLIKLGSVLGGFALVRKLSTSRKLRRHLLRAAFEHADRIPAEEVPEIFADMAGCDVLTDLLHGARSNGPMERFEQIDCPVRIAWPVRDRTLPYERYGAPLRHAVPSAEFVRLPDVGHVPMWDDPELVARTILQVTAPVDADRGTREGA